MDPAFVFLLASASPSLHSHPPASTRRRSLLIGFQACSSTANLDLRVKALIWSIWPCSLKYYRMRSTPFVMVVDKVTRFSWTSTNPTTRHGFSVHSSWALVRQHGVRSRRAYGYDSRTSLIVFSAPLWLQRPRSTVISSAFVRRRPAIYVRDHLDLVGYTQLYVAPSRETRLYLPFSLPPFLFVKSSMWQTAVRGLP